jgi:hypothetical protein
LMFFSLITTLSLELLFMQLLHTREDNFLQEEPWRRHRHSLDESVILTAPGHGVTTAQLVQHTCDCLWRLSSIRHICCTNHFGVDGATLP